MAYTKTTWVKDTTPLSAANLNNMENGIKDLDDKCTPITRSGNNISITGKITAGGDGSVAGTMLIGQTTELTNAINALGWGSDVIVT